MRRRSGLGRLALTVRLRWANWCRFKPAAPYPRRRLAVLERLWRPENFVLISTRSRERLYEIWAGPHFFPLTWRPRHS